MSTTSPIILILGAGPRVGTSVAKTFAAKGYSVALASRKASQANSTANEIHIPTDFADPGTIANAFAQVKESRSSSDVTSGSNGGLTTQWIS